MDPGDVLFAGAGSFCGLNTELNYCDLLTTHVSLQLKIL